MLVSIIIPSFRQPQFLERAIVSCLEQDHRELEVVVVEDRSGDASLAIAASFAQVDHRVKIVSCPHNGGLGKARNIGIAHASGEYLCFLDSDDYLLDRSISARLDALPAASEEHGPNVVGVYGDWQHVAETIDQPVLRQSRAVMPLVSSANYTGENVFICSAPLVRRSAVLAAGGFPEGLPMLEDFALWAKIIASGGVFVPVHHVVSTYRQRPNSMLRGDGLVVMADHVRVINDWVEAAGTPLADGGALGAWLDDRDPRSFGRMSWSVPSILGNFGGAPGATSVNASTTSRLDRSPMAVDDFMTNSVTSGLSDAPPLWMPLDPSDADLVLHVSDLGESLQAVALADVGRDIGFTIVVSSARPEHWYDTWPLALAGINPLPAQDERLAGVPSIDVGALSDSEAEVAIRLGHGVDVLWPDPVTRTGSAVFVPKELIGYPALDAWLSTALHALADHGASPGIIADPRTRSELAGYRSELTSIDRLRRCTTIVAPMCADLPILSTLAPTVVFDPSAPAGEHARTRSQLLDALGGVAEPSAERVPLDKAAMMSLLEDAQGKAG